VIDGEVKTLDALGAEQGRGTKRAFFWAMPACALLVESFEELRHGHAALCKVIDLAIIGTNTVQALAKLIAIIAVVGTGKTGT